MAKKEKLSRTHEFLREIRRAAMVTPEDLNVTINATARDAQNFDIHNSVAELVRKDEPTQQRIREIQSTKMDIEALVIDEPLVRA